MSPPLTCPHSSIGLCVPCYHERIAAGVEMPEPDPGVCICGRGLMKVLRCNIDYGVGVNVNWCGGCGVLHVHDDVKSDDHYWIPDPQFIGRK